MANGAQPSGTSATYRVLRELGRRSQRSWAAIRERNELVTIQRFTKATVPPPAENGDGQGGAWVGAETMALLLRDARCLLKNWHPNVARVRHVDLTGSELTIATELVDGVTLEDLVTLARARRQNDRDPVLPLPLLARIIVDVLGGLHGLHGLRDGINAPLNVVHGELCPANIVLGKDGVARVAHVFRPRPVKIEPRSEGLGYASPETLASEPDQDARVDLYSVGAILWEGLAGRRLFDDAEPARIAQRQREEELVRPEIPAASPFARLADVALKALAFDPALRFRTASEMATEIRRIAGTRLAPGSAVAQTVVELAGERIRARRAELDPSSSGSRRAHSISPKAPPIVADVAEPPPPTRPASSPELGLGDRATHVPTPPESERKLPAASKSDKRLPLPSASASANANATSAKPAAGSPRAVPAAKPVPAAKLPPVRSPATKTPSVAPKPLVVPAARDALARLDDVHDDAAGGRTSSPSFPEVPMTPAKADALAVATAMEVSVAEKSLFSDRPPVQPPPAPFPLTPSAAPPKYGQPVPSERLELGSVDILPASDAEPPQMDHADEARPEHESNPGEPVAVLSLEPRSNTRRKRLVPIVVGVSAVAVLLVVGGAIASLAGGSKDSGKSTAASSAAPVQTESAPVASAHATPSASAEPPSTPEPAESATTTGAAAEPADSVAGSAEEPPSSAAPPRPTGAAPAAPGFAPGPARPAAPLRKPKKSSYEPTGI